MFIDVELKKLKPNPMRDFKVDPIDEDNIKKLIESVKTHGFWSGLTGRRINNHIEIAAGHHRVEAAIRAGEKFAPMFVEDDWTDGDMVKVYAGENATQRGNTSAALAGSVASAIRFLAKTILVGGPALKNFSGQTSLESLQGHLTGEKGMGREVITDFLKGTAGINEGSVQQQLANLKASGDYARIVKEVQGEIEEENKEALRQLEKAEREQKIAIERAAKAEAERKEAAAKAKAAKEEADQKRAEYERKHAEEMAKLAEKRAKEAAEEMKKFDGLRKTRDAANEAVEKSGSKEVTFDQSVSKYFTNPYQLATFRSLVTEPEVRKILPINQQATLAKQLVDLLKQQNKESGKEKEMTSKFIEDNIKTMIFKLRTVVRNLDQEEKRQLEEKDWLRKVTTIEHEFCGACRRMYSAGMDLLELQKSKPKGINFPISAEFRNWVKEAQRITTKLASRI